MCHASPNVDARKDPKNSPTVRVYQHLGDELTRAGAGNDGILALTTTREGAQNQRNYFDIAGKKANAETAVKVAGAAAKHCVVIHGESTFLSGEGRNLDYDQECFMRANVAKKKSHQPYHACPLNMQGMPGALQVLAALLHGVQTIYTYDDWEPAIRGSLDLTVIQVEQEEEGGRGRKKEEGGRRKEEGRRRKEEGRRKKEEGRRKKEEGRRKKEEGRRKKEEGRRKKEEGRRKKEEGRRKKEEGRRKKEAGSRKQEAGSRKQEGGRGKGEEGKKEEGRRKKEEGRRKKEEGRRKKEEGRRKKEEGRRKKEEGRRKIARVLKGSKIEICFDVKSWCDSVGQFIWTIR